MRFVCDVALGRSVQVSQNVLDSELGDLGFWKASGERLLNTMKTDHKGLRCLIVYSWEF